ncbi:MAG: hypothetical protein HYR72_25195 [Deltaproteobacteria bacterium]|nr:hypothetical protein [Deltaproteobacteria bacterium]MBI3388493.1 hypothetical protein [Deltaproteobacteria bacterium]
MRDLAWWTLPGLIVAAPLALFLHAWHIEPSVGVWLPLAPVVGLLLHQSVRWRFEGDGNGFRNPQRASLAAIIERGNLTGRSNAGDVAYQVYELVFYEQAHWGAIRDHLHRCWHYVFWFRTIALACAIGAGFALLALLSGGAALMAMLLLLALPVFGVLLHQKAEQTLAALHLFDRGLVTANWTLYEQKLESLAK